MIRPIVNRSYTCIKESIRNTNILNPVLKTLKNKTYIVTGGHYGIGYNIASSIASYGGNVVILDTFTQKDQEYQNCIYTAAEEITEITQKPNCIAIDCDTTHKNHIEYALHETIDVFGSIDGIILNASSSKLYNTMNISESDVNDMTNTNIKANFLLGQRFIKYAHERGGHIIAISPPLSILDTQDSWVPHFYYTMSMMNVTMMLKTWNAEFPNISVNSIWPKEYFYSPNRSYLYGFNKNNLFSKSRQCITTGEAVKHLLCADTGLCNGNHFTDESILIGLNQL
jgi:NAD(P)-dependent dehydrogenase (short-subunit alcohol dehydrogenase family)